MTTVRDIIDLALSDTGTVADGETADPATLSRAFKTLVQMVGQWKAEGLMVYARSETSFSVTGAQSYSLGSGGSVNMTRPLHVTSAFWRDGTNDWPIFPIQSFDDYQRITNKAIAGSRPEVFHYNPASPLGELYLWPAPTSGSIHITTHAPLPSYALTSDALSVPDEYELALRYGLAELLTPEDGSALRQTIVSLARRAKKIVKRSNVSIGVLSMPPGLSTGTQFSILTGQ
jgi:hypothetical protein